MTPPSPTSLLLSVVGLLDLIGVRHHVGGSFASARHGSFRPTLDADIVVDLAMKDLDGLSAALTPQFDASRPAMEMAVVKRGRFHAVHRETSFKVDFFVMGPRAFDREEMRRASPEIVVRDAKPVVTKSAEDVVLRKLEWYRTGGEVSESHWRDAVGVLLAQAGRLDETYLDGWAAELRVSDLLDRAREQVRNS